MALIVGAVTIAGDGTATRSGAAGALYDLMIADAGTRTPSIPAGANGVGSKMAMASAAVLFATWLVDEMTTQAVVSVTVHTTDVGLQRTPNPNDPSTDTAGPGTNKTLLGTVT